LYAELLNAKETSYTKFQKSGWKFAECADLAQGRSVGNKELEEKQPSSRKPTVSSYKYTSEALAKFYKCSERAMYDLKILTSLLVGLQGVWYDSTETT
jgi:hypothetical protein